MPIRFPVHPGEILRADVLAEVGLDVAEAAGRLGVSRVALNRVVDGHAAMSPDLASRLALAGVGTARSWLALLAADDAAAARADTPLPQGVLSDAAHVAAVRGGACALRRKRRTPTVAGSREPALRRGLRDEGTEWSDLEGREDAGYRTWAADLDRGAGPGR
jgi:addiction module HigA family antidote